MARGTKKKLIPTVLPRDIRRALEAGDEVRVELGIARAMDKGWTAEQLTTALDLFLQYMGAKQLVQKDIAPEEPAQTIN